MGKVYDTSKTPTTYTLATQTPPNMTLDNFYLRNLQDKINDEWDYRSNRVDVEQEKTIGKEDFFPLEVVIQSVRNDKGDKVSDDVRRLVFRDIKHDVRLGTKFRFSYNFDLEEPNEDKNIWLSTNKDSASPTAQVVVTRCNMTLGSIFTDENGETQYHYEPVIVTTDLSMVNFYYNDVIITPQAQVMIIAQHNEFTKKYFLNQRFVVGYDKVYKVKGVNKFNSLKTYNPQDIGTILLYVELDEISVKDNFETRIAYNEADVPAVVPPAPVIDDYSFKITEPTPLPAELFSAPITFAGFVFRGDNKTDIPIQVEATLAGTSAPEDYFDLQIISGNEFTLRRRKVYNRDDLKVKCFVAAADSPVGQELSQEFALSLRGLE